ncbi:MAG: hypothetical protein ABI835_19545, partial [Chloroflexota bacterium]
MALRVPKDQHQPIRLSVEMPKDEYERLIQPIEKYETTISREERIVEFTRQWLESLAAKLPMDAEQSTLTAALHVTVGDVVVVDRIIA